MIRQNPSSEGCEPFPSGAITVISLEVRTAAAARLKIYFLKKK
jgi:hypothetical protein